MSESLVSTSITAYGEKGTSGGGAMASKKVVLDEETYTEEMEKIITRDFFPHVNTLRAQLDYIDALETGDMAKLNKIQQTYKPRTILSQCDSSAQNMCTDSPSAFGTPSVSRVNTPRPSFESERSENIHCGSVRSTFSIVSTISKTAAKTKSLDEFLAKTTSEDNASFEEICEKDAIVHQQRYPWLYKDEKAEDEKVAKALALPSGEQVLAITSGENASPVTWAYKNKNALMYVPDGVDLTPTEKLQMEKRQTIHYQNTKFAAPPFDEEANKEAIAEAASYQAKMQEGKVGIDGKEIITDDSPKVNGYGFVETPSITPGVSDTPIMTWGEIEGTPFRLDGSDTPLPQYPGGQQFKMPEIPARERIALSLADNVAKTKRQKKKDALKHAQSSWLSPSPRFGSGSPLTPSERLHSMSPAAQKLISGIHRSGDKALRASYTPSPTHTPQRDRTPDVGRSPATPKTPSASPFKRTKISLSAKKLAQIPRRQRAQDFF